jgi:thiol-disulfide isomerase/thioredoxin
MTARRVTRALTLCAVGLLTVTLAACSSGEVDDQTGGNGQAFVEGDGTVTVISPADRVAAPDLSGTTLDGTSYSMAEHAGDVVVANVWASWCAPCRAEGPALAALAKELRKDNVSFVGINTRDQEAAARAFQDHFHLGYPSISDPDGALMLTFGTSAPRNIPSTVVIDRQGRIAVTVAGSITYSGLRDLVQQVAAEPS